VSGIAGIFERDGAAADRDTVCRMVRFLSFRGPDASAVHAQGAAALGNALLRTTREALDERQPMTLEGRYWLTADARLDARVELQAKLELEGRKVERQAPDSWLILQAYAAWGGACVRHLRGDFAFAVWDAREQRMFCARDRFGVRPFYYTESGTRFLFSNTLDCLRAVAGVSAALNEAAIGDFLLFGQNCDATTTAFRDVRRIPPAHTLTVSREALRLERYWTPPVDGRVRYANPHDYVEHFQLLLQAAVADRLRTERAGILLSGGLDSGAIASTARDLSGTSVGAGNLRAFTVIYHSLIPDRDGSLAQRTAAHLGIPWEGLAADGIEIFDRWGSPGVRWPEPVDDPFLAGLFDQFGMIAADSRVALDGEGSDNLMHFQMRPYASDLLRRGELRRLLAEGGSYMRRRRSFWPGIRRRAMTLFRRDSQAAEFPKWIAPAFSKRLNLEERWRTVALGEGPLVVNAASDSRDSPAAATHPLLPEAHASLMLPQWTQLFELANAGVTRQTVEVRYPFLDLRIVNFLLAVPPFPWLFQKDLLRQAMAGRLPEDVRTRPKTPMSADPLVAHLARKPAKALETMEWSEQLSEFVNRAALPKLAGEKSGAKAAANIRPACLNFWLQSSQRIGYNTKAEAQDG
jgi:asparagine synthase (glutamine-hydrolysing)